MYRMLFLASKKVQIVKNTPCQIPTTQQKIPLGKFLIPPTGEKALHFHAISKSINSPFPQKEDFWGENWLVLALFLPVVFQDGNVFRKKSLEQIMGCKIA